MLAWEVWHSASKCDSQCDSQGVTLILLQRAMMSLLIVQYMRFAEVLQKWYAVCYYFFGTFMVVIYVGTYIKM